MTAVDSLNHVALSVRDIDASIRFYVDGLGLRKTLEKPVSANAPRALRMNPAATGRTAFVQGSVRYGQLELVEWRLPEGSDGAGPRTGGQIGHVVLSFPVADIRGVYERLQRIGATCYAEPVVSVLENYGEISMFICEDPDGYQIEIVKLPSRDEIKSFRAATGVGG